MDEDQSIDVVVEERDNIDNEQESTVNKILEHGQDYYRFCRSEANFQTRCFLISDITVHR